MVRVGKKITIFMLAIVFLMVITCFLIKRNLEKNIQSDNLINIFELSEEFMDEYFDEYKEINQGDNQDNILIVISKEKIKDSYGATKIVEAPNNQYFLQYANEEQKNKALSNLKKDDIVISAEENGYYTVDSTVMNSWGINEMSLDYAVEIANSKDLNDVTVAIIDTGCDVELANKYYNGKIAETYNVINNSTTDMTDEYGHGTHIFGTIAEGTPSNVKILPIKVSSLGNMSYVNIITAINYITYYQKADVINMSFGGYGYVKALDQAIEAAKTKNIISVCAAGNNNSSSNNYPSALDNTISIASVDNGLIKSSFSNYGSKITFTAPGTNIKSIMGKNTILSQNNGNNDDDDHEIISGTSMATPHAVSAIAILKSYNKNLSFIDTVDLLKSNSVDLGEPNWDIYYGNGLISFNGAQFCDGDTCDKYGVFKANDIMSLTKIEIPEITFTRYNYGTKYNLFNTDIRLFYSSEDYVIKKLWELDDLGLEINNYDPYKTGNQDIEIKYEGFTLSKTITSPTNWDSGWEYTKLDNNNIELTLYKNNESNIGKLYIPEQIDGYDVVSLASNNLASNISDTTSKVFSNSIDYQEFKEIVLPSTLIKLGVASLMGGSYEKITSLATNISVSAYTFAYVTSLKKFTGTISELGEGAFLRASSVDNITLSDNLTIIPNSTFASCTNLQYINIPSKLNTIGDSSFENTNIRNFVIPSGVTKIQKYAFRRCYNLENVTIPNSVTEIDEGSFYQSNIQNLYIPKSVNKIGLNAFVGCSSLEQIEVSEENPVYDSRNNSNSLIETATNTLINGIGKTIIPSTVKKIQDGAFFKNLNINQIIIPNSVIEIGNYAFWGCDNLEVVLLPRSTTTIGMEAFNKTYINSYPVFLTYTDAYAKTYAINNKINFQTINPTNIFVNAYERNYRSFDKVNKTKDISSIILYYEIGYLSGSNYLFGNAAETISSGYDVKYMNNQNSFRYGDTYYTVYGINQYGENYETNVQITAVIKAIPEYSIPINLTANIGQKLYEIELPDGFEWIDENQTIDEKGNQIYKAKYIPIDIVNYEVVEEIDIPISVNNPKTEIIPNIVLQTKEYDGTNTIPLTNITISNLSTSEYTIISLKSLAIDAGETTAKVKLKLTDEKFKTHSFDNGKQEKEFNVNFKINPKKLPKPTLEDYTYTYNGMEQEVVINNYDSEKMIISGNTRTNAGEQDVIISLDNNYIWDDNTSTNIILKFKIEKADLYIRDLSTDIVKKYDGGLYSIKLSLEYKTGSLIKFMDNNNEYTLNEIPKYSEVGTYVIKYKVFFDNNYVEYYGEKTLTITPNTIINNSTDYEGIYDGDEHSININLEPSNYTIKYSINNTNYDLTEIPTFKEVGEYIINYKISAYGYDDLIGSNTVRIYGMKELPSSFKLNDDKLIVKSNSFDNVKSKFETYSTSNAYNHYNKTGELESSDILKTGDSIKITINNIKNYEYVIIVLGDINGDGAINSADLLKIRQHLLEITSLSGVYQMATDINYDNLINSADLLRIRQHLLGAKPILES